MHVKRLEAELWKIMPLYVEQTNVDRVIAAIQDSDVQTFDEIMAMIEERTDEKLAKRELRHTIQYQFAGHEGFREIIQNAIDSYGEIGGPIGITIEESGDGHNVSVEDYGDGMTINDMLQYLFVVGSSSKKGDVSKIGKHGQGFFSVLRDAGAVDVESDGWVATMYKDENEEHKLRFVRNGSRERGTRVAIRDYHGKHLTQHARLSLDTYIEQITRYIDPTLYPVTINGHLQDEKEEVGYSETRAIKFLGRRYKMLFEADATRHHDSNTNIITQKGLWVANYHSEKLPYVRILVDIPTDIVLPRSRDSIPWPLYEILSKHAQDVSKNYTWHLLDESERRNLNSDEITFLYENLKAGIDLRRLIKYAGIPIISYPVIGGTFYATSVISETTNLPLDELMFYGLAGASIAGATALGIALSYSLINTIKSKISGRETKIEDSGISLGDYLRKLGRTWHSIFPPRVGSRKLIPANKKQRDVIQETKISKRDLEREYRRGRLYFGEVGDKDGYYVSETLERYGKKKDRQSFNLADKLTLPLRLLTIPLSAGYSVLSKVPIVIPSTYYSVASKFGLHSDEMALIEIGNYLSNLVAEGNSMQDVGVVAGYGLGFEAVTMRLPGLAPAYVLLNQRGIAGKAKREITEGHISDEVLDGLTNLVAHEYAHHTTRGFIENQSHGEKYWKNSDRTKSNFYRHVLDSGINVREDVNRIVEKYMN